MSTQRICDLDATIINPTTDLFYSITDGRTGRVKDICSYCAHSKTVPAWAASTTVQPGDRVRPVAGLGKYVFIASVGGTTGATEPAWPTTNGHAGETVNDGTVPWLVQLAPNENSTVQVKMPGTTNYKTSMYGWMSGTNEPVA